MKDQTEIMIVRRLKAKEDFDFEQIKGFKNDKGDYVIYHDITIIAINRKLFNAWELPPIRDTHPSARLSQALIKGLI